MIDTVKVRQELEDGFYWRESAFDIEMVRWHSCEPAGACPPGTVRIIGGRPHYAWIVYPAKGFFRPTNLIEWALLRPRPTKDDPLSQRTPEYFS